LTLREHRFAGPGELAEALAQALAEKLREAIALRGTASLALSGGSTPRRMVERLAVEELDWHLVNICCVDERLVPIDSEQYWTRSNEYMLRNALSTGPAAAARWFSLREDQHGEKLCEQQINSLRPFDVVVLGMGEDGHTASLFPGATDLAAGLSAAPQPSLIRIVAPGISEPRLSLRLFVLGEARARFLHIEGEQKRAVLLRALQGTDGMEMPIRGVLALPGVVELFMTGEE
jgi:6-phosphogluconolactonase